MCLNRDSPDIESVIGNPVTLRSGEKETEAAVWTESETRASSARPIADIIQSVDTEGHRGTEDPTSL